MLTALMRRFVVLYMLVQAPIALSAEHASDRAMAASPATRSEPSPTAPKSFAVQVHGQGRPMILIPGLTCSGEVWDSTVARYQDRYQLHVLTLSGFGGRPSIPAPLLGTARDELRQYIRDQKLEKPVIVGHSLGAFLAFWLASGDPDLAGPIVAVDGVPFLPALMNPAATVDSSRPQAEAMRTMMAPLNPEQFAAQNRASLAMMIKAPADVERMAQTSTKSDPAAVGQAVYELMTTDLRSVVGSIRTPVLLMTGGDLLKAPEQKQFVEAAYRQQVSSIPDHRFVMADNARHFIMLDDPAFFFTTLDGFLRDAKDASRKPAVKN